MAEWGRILLGGFGCFLLAWAGLALDAKVDGLPIWLADALLIFLVLGRPVGIGAAVLAAGAIGIFAAHLPQGTMLLIAAGNAAASVLVALLACWGLARFAPQAVRLESAGALLRLLMLSAVLPPLAGALLIATDTIAAGRPELAIPAFANWWCAAALGNTVLLPPLLALGNRALADPKLLQSRWAEATCVILLVLLTALALHPESTGLPLFFGLPLLAWSGLRFDFRTTALLCLMVALTTVMAAAVGMWPIYWEATDEGAVRALQAYLLAIILPALFASLLTHEQRATNAARLTALQALRAVMDAVPAAIVTLTPGGKVGLWSRGAERIFGWKRAQAEGRDPLYLAPENEAQAKSLRQRVLAGNEIQNQPIQRRNQAGEARDLLVNAVPQRDGDGAVTGIIAVMEDVTDRLRLQTSREEHRAHLAAILDAVAAPIITSDENGIITSFSRAAETVFGYSASEAMGRNLSILMPEPDRGRHDGYLRRYRETGVARLIGTSRQVTAQRKDGTTFPAEIAISEAWLSERRIFAGIVRDLSAKPAAAATAQGEARQPDRDFAKFLSKITHDLRQPLHALTLMTGALERRVEDPEARELVDHLSQIVRSTQATFENIVEWTRLENGLIGSVPGRIAAGDVLASLAQEFETEAARHGLAFRWVATRAPVACDPVLLRRILRQFLDNAVKYTPAGKILLGARRHGAHVRLIVADSGVGVPADQLDFIFQEYNQLDPGREAGGLGLGLAIARRLATLAGLSIGVRSIAGKGSLFWVEVPRSGG